MKGKDSGWKSESLPFYIQKYVDGHYVRPHGFQKGSIKINQTFTLSAQDAAIQRFANSELRDQTANGDYLFVENHYVYNAPLYVGYGAEGNLELTDYARAHMDECCLAFDMTITSKVEAEYHTVCFLNREPCDVTFDITYHNGFQNAPQDRQVAIRKKQQAEWLEIRKKMTDDPEQCMDLLLEWRGMKYTDLGDIEKDGVPFAGEMVFTNKLPAPPTGDHSFRLLMTLAVIVPLLFAGAYLLRRKRGS